MPSYLDNSEALKVDTKELEDHVLAPNEPRVDTDHIARQARGAQTTSKMVPDLQQTRSKRDLGPVWQDGKSIGECS